MKHQSERHEFAIYVPGISKRIKNSAIGGSIVLEDKDVYHRMVHVLRLKYGDLCLLFDQDMHVQYQIQNFESKKKIGGILKSKKSNTVLSPEIVFLLPILKRGDLDEAVYLLTEMGISSIKLIITAKAQRSLREPEYARLQRVIISAAEQSKHFAFPKLYRPDTLSNVLQYMKDDDSEKIFFDPSGISVFQLCNSFAKNKKEKLFLLVGPEGDLTTQEKKQIIEKGFVFVALTQTVLKASHAVGLGAGILCSFFSSFAAQFK